MTSGDRRLTTPNDVAGACRRGACAKQLLQMLRRPAESDFRLPTPPPAAVVLTVFRPIDPFDGVHDFSRVNYYPNSRAIPV